jgi:hypothetical protein
VGLASSSMSVLLNKYASFIGTYLLIYCSSSALVCPIFTYSSLLLL